MRYHDITSCDMKNGPGLRVVLWVAGCSHKCKGCQNPLTWDPEGGLLFDESAKKELFDALSKEWCSGLTLSGGDPLYPGNRDEILRIVSEFKNLNATKWGLRKDIWCYTGYTLDELLTQSKSDYILSLLLKDIDVIVDGEYQEEKRDISRYWVGSDNQRIWQRDSNGHFIEMPKEYLKSLSEEQHEKEKGCDC